MRMKMMKERNIEVEYFKTNQNFHESKREKKHSISVSDFFFFFFLLKTFIKK